MNKVEEGRIVEHTPHREASRMLQTRFHTDSHNLAFRQSSKPVISSRIVSNHQVYHSVHFSYLFLLPSSIIIAACRTTHELASVRLPGSDGVARHRQVNRVHHDRISRACTFVGRWSRWARNITTIQKSLVVRRVVLLLETGRKSEIRELDVTRRVDKNIVWLDVTVAGRKVCKSMS